MQKLKNKRSFMHSAQTNIKIIMLVICRIFTAVLFGLSVACSNESDSVKQLNKLNDLTVRLESMDAAFESESAVQCINPMSGISEKLVLAAEKEGVSQTLKFEFVGMLKLCDKSYKRELSLLKSQFIELSDESKCKQRATSFVSKQKQFAEWGAEIESMPLDTELAKTAAGRFIANTSIAVIADIGGLQLHRTISCQMEALTPKLSDA